MGHRVQTCRPGLQRAGASEQVLATALESVEFQRPGDVVERLVDEFVDFVVENFTITVRPTSALGVVWMRQK